SVDVSSVSSAFCSIVSIGSVQMRASAIGGQISVSNTPRIGVLQLIAHTPNQVADVGYSITLTASDIGGVPMFFQWFHNGAPLAAEVDTSRIGSSMWIRNLKF
ncbi:MAG: hypothetical protein L0287_36460, partial [Anaerolineae bacterium]|nr:hypothetical protein [Anaerolineae bacterium]